MGPERPQFDRSPDEEGLAAPEIRAARRAKSELAQMETRELLDKYPQVTGRFYHGSPQNVDELLPSSVTGNIRAGEEERRQFKDVIFLSDNMDKAIEYAGPNGVIFLTDATATQYQAVAADLLSPKKAKSVQEDIYIALPEDIKVVAKWHKEKGRKRGQPQKYIDEYRADREAA